MINLVLGYSFLKTSGIYFLTMYSTIVGNTHGLSKLWNIKFIYVDTILDTVDFAIPNPFTKSNSSNPE